MTSAWLSAESLAVATDDGLVRLWRLGSDKRGEPVEQALLRGHAGPVTAVGLTPKGDEVVTGGADRAVRLWNVDPRDPAVRICEQAIPRMTRAEWDRHFAGLDFAHRASRSLRLIFGVLAAGVVPAGGRVSIMKIALSWLPPAWLVVVGAISKRLRRQFSTANSPLTLRESATIRAFDDKQPPGGAQLSRNALLGPVSRSMFAIAGPEAPGTTSGSTLIERDLDTGPRTKSYAQCANGDCVVAKTSG